MKKTRWRRGVRLAQLELLAAMERAPTLSAAARSAGVAQPAASRLLRELEQRTGVELFEKFGRTLRPTLAGRLLLERASRLIGELDRLEDDLKAIDQGLIGSVSIGAGAAPCFVLIPQAIAELTRGSAKISVKLREGGIEELTEELRAGRIDLVVGRFEYSSRDKDLELESLYDPPVNVVCGPKHRLAGNTQVSLREAIRTNWLLPQEGTSMRRGIESLFRTENVWPTECPVESSSIQANVALLNVADLLWVVSADIAAHFAKNKQLSILPLPLLKGPGPILMASLKGRVLTAPAKRLQHSLRLAAKHVLQSIRSRPRQREAS